MALNYLEMIATNIFQVYHGHTKVRRKLQNPSSLIVVPHSKYLLSFNLAIFLSFIFIMEFIYGNNLIIVPSFILPSFINWSSISIRSLLNSLPIGLRFIVLILNFAINFPIFLFCIPNQSPTE